MSQSSEKAGHKCCAQAALLFPKTCSEVRREAFLKENMGLGSYRRGPGAIYYY